MIETENESLRERVCDLEKKVLEQGDEIVCLRSTLADVLRRLNQLEGCRTLSLNSSVLKNGSTPRAAGTFVRKKKNQPFVSYTGRRHIIIYLSSVTYECDKWYLVLSSFDSESSKSLLFLFSFTVDTYRITERVSRENNRGESSVGFHYFVVLHCLSGV